MTMTLLNKIIQEKSIADLPSPLLIHGYPKSEPNQIAETISHSLFLKLSGKDSTHLESIEWENQADAVLINSNNSPIKITEIKDLQQRLNIGPKNNPFILVTVFNCEQLTHSAANAFLKTLEEPPCPTLFILSSSQYQKVLPTIQSRCLPFFIRESKQSYEENDFGMNLKDFLSLSPQSKHEWLFNTIQEKEAFKSLLLNWLESLKPFENPNAIYWGKFIVEYLKKLEYNINLNLNLASFLASIIELNSQLKES